MAMQGTPLQEYRRSDSRPVVDGKPFDIKDKACHLVIIVVSKTGNSRAW